VLAWACGGYPSLALLLLLLLHLQARAPSMVLLLPALPLAQQCLLLLGLLTQHRAPSG
jgi:hypothetical protein